MDPVVMINLEVGADDKKKNVVGKYAAGRVSVELDAPVEFGKLRALLKRYDVNVDSWPSFLQKALDLEAKLWALDYGPMTLGTTSATTLVANSFKAEKDITFPTDLDGAELSADSSDKDGKKYLVKKNGAELNYWATKSDGTYKIEANAYRFVIQGAYAQSLELIKGLVALKSIAFGITNDPRVKEADFEIACRKVLVAEQVGTALPGPK